MGELGIHDGIDLTDVGEEASWGFVASIALNLHNRQGGIVYQSMEKRNMWVTVCRCRNKRQKDPKAPAGAEVSRSTLHSTW